MILALCFLIGGVWLLRRIVAPLAGPDAAAFPPASESLPKGSEPTADLAASDGEAPPSSAPQCHAEANAEYGGKVVRWGADHLKESGEMCCEACKGQTGCTVWVWCVNPPPPLSPPLCSLSYLFPGRGPVDLSDHKPSSSGPCPFAT